MKRTHHVIFPGVRERAASRSGPRSTGSGLAAVPGWLPSPILAAFLVAGIFGAAPRASAQATKTVTQQAVCATVKLVIPQKVTFEREAFDASLGLTNRLKGLPLEDLSVEVIITDMAGTPVPSAFFLTVTSMDQISGDIDGTGVIAPNRKGTVKWLLIPTAGAGGQFPGGVQYKVHAVINFTAGTEPHTLKTFEDIITVHPQPELTLEYFLPRRVPGDDPFTPEIEPSLPYELAVRVHNIGYGAAKKLKIQSFQPKIVENKQGLLIDFSIIGTWLGNQEIAKTMTVDFGTLDPAKCKMGAWAMTTSLEGIFKEIGVTFTHKESLGGEKTSLIKSALGYLLVHRVQMTGAGKDDTWDVLALPGSVLPGDVKAADPDFVYESDCGKTPVNNVPAQLVAGGPPTLANPTVKVIAQVQPGWNYFTVADPAAGTLPIKKVTREDDGKVLHWRNGWTDQEVLFHSPILAFFDDAAAGGTGVTQTYLVEFDFSEFDTEPPVSTLRPLQPHTGTNPVYASPWTVFLVDATDSLSTVVLTEINIDGKGWEPKRPFYFPVLGQHVVLIRSKDAKNNVEVPKSYTIFVENKAPVISVVTPATNANITLGTPLLVQIFVVDATDPNPTVTATLVPQDGSASIPTAHGKSHDLPAGDYELVVDAEDWLGNKATTVVVPFAVKPGSPVITITGVADGQYYRQPVTPVATVVGTGIQSVLRRVDGFPVSEGVVVNGEGSHSFEVTATDGFGQQTTAKVSFVLDLTPPKVVVTGVADGQIYSTVVSASVSVIDLNLQSVVTRLDGQLYANGAEIAAAGSHVLEVSAQDKAGNLATVALSFILQLNDTLPCDKDPKGCGGVEPLDPNAPRVQILQPNLGTKLLLPDGAGPGDPPVANAVPVEVVLSVKNFALGPQPDGPHLVLYLDGAKVADLFQTAPYSIAAVGFGEHTLAAELVNADGTMPGAKSARAVQAFRVKKVCGTESDCDDGNACNLDRCLPSAAKTGWKYCAWGPDPHALEQACCNNDFDCGVGQQCLSGVCIDCLSDGDCNDEKFCTVDACVDKVCTYAWQVGPSFGPLGYCCEHDGDCNDGDACTKDACDPATHACSHSPSADPRCCNTSADCDDSDACTRDRCIRHRCRYGPVLDCCTKSADCGDDNPCTTDLCDPTTRRCVYQVSASPVAGAGQGVSCCTSSSQCDDGKPQTVDYCEQGLCQHIDSPLYCDGSGNHPCLDDGNPTTVDACLGQVCTHTPIDGACVSAADCNDKDPCTKDSCLIPSGGSYGSCAHAARAGCCLSDGDCGDADACTLDRCIAHTCRHGPDPTAPRPCCTQAADCNDGNVCTVETCNPDHSCSFAKAPQLSCCMTPAECDDGNPLTVDACKDHECAHTPTGSCTKDADCDDANPCTAELCAQGSCTSNAVVGCCSTKADCDDGDTCTADACTAVNTCTHVPKPGCCHAAADCDDGKACTEDVCVGGSCRHLSAPSGCCTRDADCVDGNPCTQESCDPATRVCKVQVVAGDLCCETVSECNDGDACTKDLCVQNTCVHKPAQSCCAQDADCGDGDVCTTDRCIFGSCKHFPPDHGLSTAPDICCTADADCPSGGGKCVTAACGPKGLCTFAKTSCTFPLPYEEGFGQLRPVDYFGWSVVNLPGSDDVTKNWQVTGAGPLGPDGHMRLHWAPTSAAYDTVLVSPGIDTAGASHVTVRLSYDFGPSGGVTKLAVLAKTSAETWANAAQLWNASPSAAAGGSLVLPVPAPLVGQVLQLGIQARGTTTFDLNAFDVDDVAVVSGRPPVFTETPPRLVAVLNQLASFTLRARDDDGDALSFHLVDAPKYAKLKPAKFDAASGTWSVALLLYPVADHQAGASDLTVEVRDGALTARTKIPMHVLLGHGYAVWRPSGVPAGAGQAIADAIAANGRAVQVLDDLTLYPNLVTLDGVFVTLGVFGGKHVPTGAETSLLAAYLQGGGRVYLEGGDAWSADLSPVLAALFRVKATGGGVQTLQGPLAGADLATGLDFAYTQSPLQNNFLDLLALKDSQGLANRAVEAVAALPAAITAVAYDAAKAPVPPLRPWRTLGASRLLSGLVESGANTRAALVGAYLDFLEKGYPTKP